MNKGDWVKVWGQVVEDCPSIGDVLVELFSHNEQYKAYVRADRVELANVLPPFAPMCTSLVKPPGLASLFRCDLPANHPNEHVSAACDKSWSDGKSYGWVEEA